jgi:hypothetical protein
MTKPRSSDAGYGGHRGGCELAGSGKAVQHFGEQRCEVGAAVSADREGRC